jgi:hypothetical protein
MKLKRKGLHLGEKKAKDASTFGFFILSIHNPTQTLSTCRVRGIIKISLQSSFNLVFWLKRKTPIAIRSQSCVSPLARS